MDAAEAAYNNYRQARGSLDLNLETQSVLQSLVEVDNQIVALRRSGTSCARASPPSTPACRPWTSACSASRSAAPSSTRT
jgi:tyrosine-protein kinase Etk/Wzc